MSFKNKIFPHVNDSDHFFSCWLADWRSVTGKTLMSMIKVY